MGNSADSYAKLAAEYYEKRDYPNMKKYYLKAIEGGHTGAMCD